MQEVSARPFTAFALALVVAALGGEQPLFGEVPALAPSCLVQRRYLHVISIFLAAPAFLLTLCFCADALGRTRFISRLSLPSLSLSALVLV